MPKREQPVLPRRRTSGLIERAVDDSLVVYDRKTDTAHALHGAASRIWPLCDGRTSVTEAAKTLDLPAVDVAAALAELDVAGLLAPNHASRRTFLRGSAIAGGTILALPLVESLAAPAALAAASTSQVFNSDGTFVVPAGTKRVEVTLIGGGGGGGDGFNLGGVHTAGGHGGAAAEMNAVITFATPTASNQTVNIHIGGGGSSPGAGGSGTPGAGGTGGHSSNGTSLVGGGGGGTSSIESGATQILVACGGGGGGDARTQGDGGDGGSSGSGSASVVTGNSGNSAAGTGGGTGGVGGGAAGPTRVAPEPTVSRPAPAAAAAVEAGLKAASQAVVEAATAELWAQPEGAAAVPVTRSSALFPARRSPAALHRQRRVRELGTAASAARAARRQT